MARNKSKSAKKKKTKNSNRTLAEKADKFKCYQKSVQSPEHEVEFFEQAFKDAYRRKPYTLREDFCGTFAVCCDWIKTNKKRTAIGVDLCGETLQWGRENNLATLDAEQQSRIKLLEQDVRKKNRPKVDVLAAQNFSFWIFKTRKEVTDYFRAARANLADEGVMVMDMMGGGDCFLEDHTDKRTIKKGKKGFKYYWEQSTFNPVNHDASFYIHFKFKDGSQLKRAFEYHWRFWSIPEVREMLADAGFSETHVYFEEEDDDGEETGIWSRSDTAASAACWLCYVVAIK